MNLKRILILSYFLYLGLVVGYVSHIFYDNGFTAEVFSGFLVQGLGTVTTLLLIYLTLQEGKRDRRDLRLAGKNERIILRLREQMAFYAPLVTEILRIEESDYGKLEGIVQKIQSNYEYLSEDELIKTLRVYYRDYHKNTNRWKTKDYGEHLNKIRGLVLGDFEMLKKVYLAYSEIPDETLVTLIKGPPTGERGDKRMENEEENDDTASTNKTEKQRVSDALVGALFGLAIGLMSNIWIAYFERLFIENMEKDMMIAFFWISTGLLMFLGWFLWAYIRKLESS